MIKKGIKYIFFIMILICLWNCNSIWYGIQQGKGQLGIVYGAKPIQDFLDDSSYPDSLKRKLELVKEIKKYAIDSLGINPSENYEKLYNQNGKPVMWVVTGCDSNALNPYYWEFPILGRFTYKGHFKKSRAVKDYNELIENGFDAEINVVNAWSTLGWFKDPVMSSMLEKSPGQLARVLIHELTHGTLYVKNDIQFNENLASFVGDRGAAKFLEWKYGMNSKELADYKGDLSDMKKIRTHLLIGTEELNSFYSENSAEYIFQHKSKKIKSIVTQLDTLTLYNKSKLSGIFSSADTLNNTFFTDFLTYRKEQNSIEKEFMEEFQGDYEKYLIYLKEKYPSL